MKTVSQERAGFAYDKVREAIGKTSIKDFSSFVAGLPAMILQNGLGHTLCFLLAKSSDQKEGRYKEKDKHYLAFEALVSWLAKRKVLEFDPSRPAEVIHRIMEKSSLELMALQEEALKFLEWFKVMSKMFVEER